MCSPEGCFEMFKSGGARLLNQFFLRKDLIQVDFECGLYFRLDKDVPEEGNCPKEAVMSAILSIHTENAQKF